MIGFLFMVVIAILVLGLLWYLIKWGVQTLGLPQPILVILTVLMVIFFLYWIWAYFPAGAMGSMPHPIR
jgi:hypothetical protein